MHLLKFLVPAGLLIIVPAVAATPASDFAQAMTVAMDRMMARMHVAPTHNIDRDFVAMMVPHHQGAIDMAIAEIQYGQDPVLKRIAQEIIVEQQQEIGAMRMAVGDPLPPSAPAPTQSRTGASIHRHEDHGQ